MLRNMSMPEPIKPLKPGALKKLPVPDEQPTAMGTVALQRAEEIATLLRSKIAHLENEIARLKKAKQDTYWQKTDAKHMRDEIKQMSGDSQQAIKYFAYIERECSEAVDAVIKTGKFLFRGQEDTSKPVFVGRPWDKREPRDSNADAQVLYDKNLKLMGFTALRSNSIFTTSTKSNAAEFGTIYAIFPKNGFSFTWSTVNDDLVLHSVNDVVDSVAAGVSLKDSSEDRLWEKFDDCIDYIDQLYDAPDRYLHYRRNLTADEDQAIIQIIRTGDIDSKEKLRKVIDQWQNDGLDYNKKQMAKKFLQIVETFSAIAKDIDQCLDPDDRAAIIAMVEVAQGKSNDPSIEQAKEMIERFGLKHTNFEAALKSGHEICINGEYVAVNWNQYEVLLSRYFLGTEVTRDEDDW